MIFLYKAAKQIVLRLILSSSPYLRSALGGQNFGDITHAKKMLCIIFNNIFNEHSMRQIVGGKKTNNFYSKLCQKNPKVAMSVCLSVCLCVCPPHYFLTNWTEYI